MKFSSLFKKELREMLSPQNILMLLFMLVLMYGMGTIMNSSIEEANEESSKVTICDLDNTEFSQAVIRFIEHPTKDMENEVEIITLESDDYAAELERLDIKSFVVIPEGFTEQVEAGEQAEIIYVSKMTSLATMANVNSGSETAVSLIESALKTALYSNKVTKGQITEDEVTQLESPVTVTEHTIVGDKDSEISQLTLYALVYNQSLFMPLIVYILILLGSQTMINAVTAEKVDKTLETLLSAPVSRLSIISAKMLAAAVVALVNAAVYMVGMNGMTSSLTGESTDEYASILTELGLTYSFKSYLLIGIQMLLSTLIALAISMILGAFSKSIKSSQTLLMPVMIITIIPFMVSMFMDISGLPGALRYLLYMIPFTHTFIASDNIIFGKDTLYLGGLIYQLVFLALCLAVAIKVFTSDKIFTAGEHFGKKKHKKKYAENEE